MVHQKFITKNAQETFSLGQRLGKKIKERAVFCLYGELGSGKTTFVQGLAAGLGIKRRVISPTFVFIRQYKLRTKDLGPRTEDTFTFYHIDLYRIKNLNDAKVSGIEEVLGEKNTILAIEWAEKIREILPKERIDIHFKYEGEEKRELELIANSKLLTC